MAECKTLLMIDCLLDTRMGCIRSVNEEWFDKLVQNGYHERKTNLFSKLCSEIDDEAIKAKWKTRDKEVLKLSAATPIMLIIQHIEDERKKVGDEHPNAFKIDLTVNTWPYRLTDSEINAFVELLSTLLELNSITFIHQDIRAMTPTWIKSKFNQFIFYDLEEWAAIHLKALAKNKMPDVTCIVPFIYLDTVTTKNLPENDIIKMLVMSYSTHMDIEVLPLAYFSFISNKNLPT